MRVLPVVVILLLTTSFRSASAHGEGGVLQISDRAVGPYLLYAWTSPGIARTGETHLEALLTTTDGVPVEVGKVVIVVTSLADGSRQVINTTDAQAANGFRREGVANFPVPGDYVLDLLVRMDDTPVGQTSFTLQVAPVSSWLRSGLNGMLLLLVVAGAWLLRVGMKLVLVQNQQSPVRAPFDQIRHGA